MACVKKIAARQVRVIVFIDESGLSERPCRARTWAPKVETPVLQYRFSWKQLSVIAGISFWRFYFRLFNGSIKNPQIVEFLNALQATIGEKLLIIWDGLQAHRSKLVRAHVGAQRGRVVLERLAGLRPEIEPRRMHLGLPQASRHAQLLRRGLLRPRPSRASKPAVHAATHHSRDGILEAGGAVLMSSRTYARLNKSIISDSLVSHSE